jgi:putative membrane protein
MTSLKFAVAVAVAALFGSGMVLAEGAKPNDAQIAHIAAGQLDIAAAEQATQKSKNKDVLAFAEEMERDHKAVNDKALALVKKLGVTPEDNDTSKTLSKQVADKRAELAKLSGAAFDKAR